jgi:hypothetical protein
MSVGIQDYKFMTVAGPALSYGSESWTMKRTDERRLIAAEMCFMRRTAPF